MISFNYETNVQTIGELATLLQNNPDVFADTFRVMTVYQKNQIWCYLFGRSQTFFEVRENDRWGMLYKNLIKKLAADPDFVGVIENVNLEKVSPYVLDDYHPYIGLSLIVALNQSSSEIELFLSLYKIMVSENIDFTLMTEAYGKFFSDFEKFPTSILIALGSKSETMAKAWLNIVACHPDGVDIEYAWSCQFEAVRSKMPDIWENRLTEIPLNAIVTDKIYAFSAKLANQYPEFDSIKNFKRNKIFKKDDSVVKVSENNMGYFWPLVNTVGLGYSLLFFPNALSGFLSGASSNILPVIGPLCGVYNLYSLVKKYNHNQELANEKDASQASKFMPKCRITNAKGNI